MPRIGGLCALSFTRLIFYLLTSVMLCFGKRSITEMKKAYILLMLLSLCACAKEPTPPMLGSDGREIPMVFQNFPDIPFPDEAFLVLEDSKTMGSGENWIGSISFTVNFNAGRVFDYYVAEKAGLKLPLSGPASAR